jgi:predicted DNA-binding mobile mystery protein A
MTRAQRKLRIEQLDKKLNAFSSLKTPKEGWIKTLRTVLNISPNTLANRLDISPSGLYKLEEREENGAVTIKRLEQTALAMDMQLVYGFIPNVGSLEQMIENRAKKLAIEIVRKTSINMELENQENNQERLKKAVEDKTRELIEKQPTELWD